MSDQRWLGQCLLDLEGSADPSTKVACIIVSPDGKWVLGQAVNGLPPRVRNYPDRLERPRKYLFFEHAERAAIHLAAYEGNSLRDATLYVTSAPTAFPPCADCARAIISAGIARVVQRPYSGDWARWAESCNAALDMLKEAGVAYDLVPA